MDNSGVTYMTQQLAYQLPLLLASLLGLVLSLVFLRRCPGPSILTLIATGILLLTGIVLPIAQTYLFSARLEHGWTMQTYTQLSGIVGILSALVRGLAVAMLVAAVFIGRKRPSANPV